MTFPEMFLLVLGIAVVFGLVSAGLRQRRRMRVTPTKERPMIRVESPSIESGRTIPDRHARDGDDRSPELRWQDLPPNTAEVAVICEDPDVPKERPFVHWMLWGLPPDRGGIEEATDAGTPGRNDFGDEGYGGPQPPKGHGKHHYHFRVIALDAPLKLERGASRDEFEAAARGHVIEQGQLVGTYER